MAGNDRIDGGGGIHDMISFLEKPNPINALFFDPAVSLFKITYANMAEFDLFINIEDLQGTEFDDAISGWSDNNTFYGEGGNGMILNLILRYILFLNW